MPTPAPSAGVMAARARRIAAGPAREARIEWFTAQVKNDLSLTLRQRVIIATELVRSQVVTNISKPVTKGTGPRGGRTITDRSLPGEFPRADTTLLMKTIFTEVQEVTPGSWAGYIGTPLDYGLILEIHMGRPFLVRTLNDLRSKITEILTAPIA